ncbi:MAG: response regulator [Desulfobacterales bacterium]|nr:response regulator [Desulfobacterales bacterium]
MAKNNQIRLWGFYPFCLIIPNNKKTEINIGKLNILIVEDDILNQEVAASLLNSHKVVVVKNGIDAIKILEKENFDVVLMDIEMPEMNGLETTKIIRDSESNVLDHNIPIIAMTAHEDTEDKDRFIKCGMNGYLSKPVISKKLFEVIHQVMNE